MVKGRRGPNSGLTGLSAAIASSSTDKLPEETEANGRMVQIIPNGTISFQTLQEYLESRPTEFGTWSVEKLEGTTRLVAKRQLSTYEVEELQQTKFPACNDDNGRKFLESNQDLKPSIPASELSYQEIPSVRPSWISASQSDKAPNSQTPPSPNPLPQSDPTELNEWHDKTGQICPPGFKARVTASLWDEEGTLCFQVEYRDVWINRREDNHFINGTKLLIAAGVPETRRNYILASERHRHVVLAGPMHLQGVWIPFERALYFANCKNITEHLWPLFVHDIHRLLYHPTNSSRVGDS